MPWHGFSPGMCMGYLKSVFKLVPKVVPKLVPARRGVDVYGRFAVHEIGDLTTLEWRLREHEQMPVDTKTQSG